MHAPPRPYFALRFRLIWPLHVTFFHFAVQGESSLSVVQASDFAPQQKIRLFGYETRQINVVSTPIMVE